VCQIPAEPSTPTQVAGRRSWRLCRPNTFGSAEGWRQDLRHRKLSILHKLCKYFPFGQRTQRKKEVSEVPTDVLIHPIGVIAPFRKAFDQVAQHRRHPIRSLQIFEEKYLLLDSH